MLFEVAWARKRKTAVYCARTCEELNPSAILLKHLPWVPLLRHVFFKAWQLLGKSFEYSQPNGSFDNLEAQAKNWALAFNYWLDSHRANDSRLGLIAAADRVTRLHIRACRIPIGINWSFAFSERLRREQNVTSVYCCSFFSKNSLRHFFFSEMAPNRRWESYQLMREILWQYLSDTSGHR